MALGGEAVMAMAVMWSLVAIVSVLLILRVYTRFIRVTSYGTHDHMYMVAFLSLVLYVTFIHASANYGFGQSTAAISDPDKIVKATMYECIGKSFGIVGMAVAKWAVGFFLLQLVTVQWHRSAVWFAMLELGVASIAQMLCFWLSCRPIQYIYDRRIPGGYCPTDTRTTSYILCVSVITVDIFFALFPWVFLWDLQMSRNEKITIAASLSLGLFAAAAGILRAIEIPQLYGPEYLRNSVGLIIWSATEIAVTMICIGIPACYPLCKHVFRRPRFTKESSGYEKQDKTHSDSAPIRTIEDGCISGAPPKDASAMSQVANNFADMKIDVQCPFAKTLVNVGQSRLTLNNSNEEILGQEYQQQNHRERSDERSRTSQDDIEQGHSGMMVTAMYGMERS